MSAALTIPSNDRVERLVAAAGQTVFSYDFPIYAGADIEVRRFRADVQTLLVNGADYTVAGVGAQPGGTITLATPAQAGDLLVIRSAQPVARGTAFNNGGDLPAQSLNAELNRIFISFQQLLAAINQAIRLPASDPVAAGELATAAARSNALLGFNSAGAIELVSRASVGGGSFQQTGTGGVVRTVQDELRQIITPTQFGAVGDGATDDTMAVQRAANEASARGAFLYIRGGVYRITAPVTFPGGCAGGHMEGLLRYAGAAGQTALTIGDGGAAINRNKRWTGLRIERATQADWTNAGDIGLVLQNADACVFEVLQVEGFTIGLRTFGDGRGFEDSTLVLGRLANNQVQLDVRTNAVGSWNNAVRYIGGHFANASATNPTLDRFGVRFSRAAGGYNLHNHHVFYGPAFELQNQGGAVAAIPFLSEVNSRSVVAHGIRIEGNSPQVARHTAGAQDHVYEVAFSSNGAITGTEGNAYLLTMDYPGGATRAGGTIVPLHQAAAAKHSPKLIAAAPSVRAAAFRWSSSEVGFEGMAVLSSNPAGPPTTLNGLAFPGLSQFTLSGDTVQFPTSRAVGFIVNAATCKDFFIAFEGAFMRPTIMLFDQFENVQGIGVVPLLSNQSLAWNDSAQWWQSSADSEDATYTRLQRVTLPGQTWWAFIGVGSSDPAGTLRALRLYVPEIHHPQVLAGGGRQWGARELFTSAAWDPPSIAAGASTTTDVALANAVPGDFVDAAFSVASVLPLEADMPSTGNVRARFTNNTGGPVDINPGTLFIRATKPRL